MSIRFFFILSFLLSISTSLFAQVSLEGNVVDADTQAPLAFVNIGIRNKNIGTRSLADGSFSIQIPAQNRHDTLTFSMVGYTELKISIRDIVEGKQDVFKLTAKIFSPVLVTPH